MEYLAAKPCSEIIPKYVEDENIQKEILAQFTPLENTFLCPDTPNYEIFLSAWIFVDEVEYEQFGFVVKPKEGADPELLE